jgi:HK97 family phage major capsid protein
MEVQDALKMGWDANASWLMSRASRSVVRKLKYSSGTNEYIWELSTQAGVPANMLGKPVQIMEDMPSMSTGNVSFVYGDIRSAYVIVDRVGMSILDDPYSGGNVRYLKYRSRYGGGIVNYDAIKYLQQA